MGAAQPSHPQWQSTVSTLVSGLRSNVFSSHGRNLSLLSVRDIII